MGTPQEKGAKVAFFNSMRFRMLLCVMLSVVIVGVVMLVMIIPVSSGQISKITQNYILDITQKVGEEVDTLYGTLGEEKTKEILPSIVKGVGVKEVDSSYCYVVDGEGNMVYHPTAEKIGKPVENAVVKGIVEEVQAGKKVESTVVAYDFDGVTKYAAYYVCDEMKYTIVVTADENEILSPISYMLRRAITGAVVALLICLVTSVIMLTVMLRPLEIVSRIVNRFAYMDFRSSEENRKFIKRKDEIGVIGRATEDLRQHLVTLIEDLQNQSGLLYTTSEQLQGEAVETSDVIDQVDNAVHDIADGATSQANETQAATDNVLVIGTMIQESNGSIRNIRENSEQIQNSAQVASDTLKQLNQINIQVKRAIDEIYEQTHTTNESAVKIKEAAALITSIAEETNLLSLNASIEAARAGEHGRGFAVVANQIQKLAEQSNESANRIEGIISDLIGDSERSVATMEEVREIVEQQNLSVQKTDEIFQTVQSGINRSMDDIEKIFDETAKMESARVGVTDTVQNLTAIAEENAASTQETSASVTAVRNSVDTISDSANGLNDIAMKLEETMKRFKIE